MALHPLETYLQTAMRRPDAKPIIYTGRNTWINVIQDHGAAFVTNDANAADRLTIDFSTYPLWWAWLANDALDPMNAAQMATIRSPVAWRATPPKSIILQYSGHVEFPGHEAEDGSVIAQIDTAGPITLSNDFTPLLSLARVAPPTADIELTRVTDLSDQPPDQVFSLLLIGQGFWADEFADVVQQGLFGRFTTPVGPMGAVATVHARQGLADIAPLNLLAANAGRNAFACYYDAGTHADGTGLSLPLRQERVRGTGLDPSPAIQSPIKMDPCDALRIPHQVLVAPQTVPPGRSLAEYLSRLTVRLSDGTIRRATEFWPIGQKRTGPKGALIAVLRRAPFVTHNAAGSVPDAPRPAELYQLDPTTDDPVPCIAVNVVPGGDWPLVLARAIAQNLAGLADEYELEGAGFTQPPEGVANPLAPNVVVLDDTRAKRWSAAAPSRRQRCRSRSRHGRFRPRRPSTSSRMRPQRRTRSGMERREPVLRPRRLPSGGGRRRLSQPRPALRQGLPHAAHPGGDRRHGRAGRNASAGAADPVDHAGVLQGVRGPAPQRHHVTHRRERGAAHRDRHATQTLRCGTLERPHRRCAHQREVQQHGDHIGPALVLLRRIFGRRLPLHRHRSGECRLLGATLAAARGARSQECRVRGL